MEAKLEISLYSYPYLNEQKSLVLPVNVYTLSSTKLEIRAKQFLLGSEGVQGPVFTSKTAKNKQQEQKPLMPDLIPRNSGMFSQTKQPSLT
jgi:hypothetical protein